MNLGVLLTDLTRFDEALDCLRESLRINPQSHEAHDNLGSTLGRLGDYDAALAAHNRAIKLQPYHADAHRNRSFIWLIRGDFEQGWAEYEWRLRSPRYVGLSPECPRWNGEDLTGKTILLHSEQGVGDTIQFIRYVAQVREHNPKAVVVICAECLLRLISRFPGVDFVTVAGNPVPDYEVHASLLSLPAIVHTTLDTVPSQIPYLSAHPSTIEFWRSILASVREPVDSQSQPQVNVGIVWQGNPRHRSDRTRSFPLRALEPLARIPGVRLISLQRDDGVDQLRALDGRFHVAEIWDRVRESEAPRDFLDTAAIIGQLDLVVTPDTAVAHLAGSLGARVWVALSSVGEWRWLLERDDSPWYPSMRLFRQTSPGDWGGVFARMAECLKHEICAADAARIDTTTLRTDAQAFA
jgi:hypothetical protein